jgi:hypothetical protein
VILSPDFYKPENYDLEIATHNTIRNMLLLQTTTRINKIEYFHLRRNEDYFKFIQVKNSSLRLNVFDKIADYFRFRLYVILLLYYIIL